MFESLDTLFGHGHKLVNHGLDIPAMAENVAVCSAVGQKLEYAALFGIAEEVIYVGESQLVTSCLIVNESQRAVFEIGAFLSTSIRSIDMVKLTVYLSLIFHCDVRCSPTSAP